MKPDRSTLIAPYGDELIDLLVSDDASSPIDRYSPDTSTRITTMGSAASTIKVGGDLESKVRLYSGAEEFRPEPRGLGNMAPQPTSMAANRAYFFFCFRIFCSFFRVLT